MTVDTNTGSDAVDGEFVGDNVTAVGVVVSAVVWDGIWTELVDGATVGTEFGNVDGEVVGSADGADVGSADGADVGMFDGKVVGISVGFAVGIEVGTAVGTNVGTLVGTSVGPKSLEIMTIFENVPFPLLY